jgi:hypothetical protein
MVLIHISDAAAEGYVVQVYVVDIGTPTYAGIGTVGSDGDIFAVALVVFKVDKI